MKLVKYLQGMSRGVDSTGSLPGVVFSNGKTWEEQRQFFKETLVNLGMGKPTGTLLDIICQEQENFCDILAKRAKKQENQVNVSMLFYELTGNIGMRLISGKAHKQDDPQVFRLSYLVRDLFNLLDRSNIIETLQMNNKLVAQLSCWLGIRSIIDVCKPLNDVAKLEASNGTPNTEAGNFVDRYLAKMENAKPDTSFYGSDGRLHILGQIFDLYIGGA